MTHVFGTMGTVVSLELPGGHPDATVLREVERIFADADARYSLYRDDSELSAIAAGRLALPEASAELRDLYASALEWRGLTGGSFTPHRPDGVIDLSGLVKAWAMDVATTALTRAGQHDFSLDVGGDIITCGQPVATRPWSAGIVDPADRTRLLTAVTLTAARPALATSGSAERGDHIWRSTRLPGTEFVQVSVRAPGIILADVMATAIVAGGPEQLDALAERWPIDVMTVDAGGAITMTPGMREAMHEHAAIVRR